MENTDRRNSSVLTWGSLKGPEHDDDYYETAERINECLTLKYMEVNEPWTKLPLPYNPSPFYHHNPPRFVYGFGFSWDELIDYAVRKGLSPRREELGFSGLLLAWNDAVRQLNIDCGLADAPFQMQIHTPLLKHADLVLVLWDNHSTEIPFPTFSLSAAKKMIGIWKKEGIPKRPKWWISDDIDLSVTDYRVHLR
ncbi:hypothetical protein D9758_017631 [Tetrapyrgos nigripes]|uniref:Uncharacterized protein n=1 Tax=Tetrapyrgos nigripes TaxID=182062 RepID=A0A8H5CGG6_9AGAR|nr:hypothetical protein D9758_017631 [Tetrapyrgos nigripes]